MYVCRGLSVCRSRSFLSSCGPSRPRAVGASPSSVAVFFSEISCMCALVERMNERKKRTLRCIFETRTVDSIRSLRVEPGASRASRFTLCASCVSRACRVISRFVRYAHARSYCPFRLVSCLVSCSRVGRDGKAGAGAGDSGLGPAWPLGRRARLWDSKGALKN